jgi:hypothetical protein
MPRRIVTAFTFLLLTTTILLAQTAKELPTRQAITPEDLVKTGERLRNLQQFDPKSIDPKLLEAIQKLIQQNPNATPEKLAKQLLETNPGLLSDPAKLAKSLQAMQSMAGKMPAMPSIAPVTPSAFPKVEPGQVPPTATGTQPPPVNSKPGPTPSISQQSVKPNLDSPKLEAPKQRGGPVAENFSPGSDTPPPKTVDISPESKQFQQVAGWWEKNIGPMKDSPAMKDLLAEFIKGAGSTDGKSPLSGIMDGMQTDAMKDSGNWLNSTFKDFKLPDLGLKGVSSQSFQAPTTPEFSSGGLGSMSADSFLDSTLPVMVLIVAITLGLGIFWLIPRWQARRNATPKPVPGLGPWPLDPRKITDRESFVRAFEYLSVLTLGQESRQFNHLVIAQELRLRVPQSAGIADDLGDFYSLARYTPPTDPISPETIQAARVKLCQLAGVAS